MLGTSHTTKSASTENMRDFISSLSARYTFDRSYLERIFAKLGHNKALNLIKPLN